MRKFILVGVASLSLGCQPSTSERQTTDSKKPTAAVEASVESAIASTPASTPSETITSEPTELPLLVQLAPGATDSPEAPRYSPPGRALKLMAVDAASEFGMDALETEVALGWPEGMQKPFRFLFTRSEADGLYVNAYIDLNRDGVFDEPKITGTTSNSRGKTWINFDCVLPVSYSSEKEIVGDYPVLLWLTVESNSEKPEVVRMSRRGFKIGTFEYRGKTHKLILSDSNNDAIFGANDWWEVLSENSVASPQSMRKVGDFLWIGDEALELQIDQVDGSVTKLIKSKTTLSREEDALARDPFGEDKRAPKAAMPLEFRHDVDAALAEAIEKKLPCFIKFETTWCGPCKSMTEHVFTAQQVVDAAAGVVCVKIDGDERKDLVERFKVTGYPTGIMLAGNGDETKRFIGYQKVKNMSEFLKDNRTTPQP